MAMAIRRVRNVILYRRDGGRGGVHKKRNCTKAEQSAQIYKQKSKFSEVSW